MFHGLLFHNRLILSAMAIALVAGAAGCASVGTPGGGLYDETPPYRRSSKPDEGATNVSDRKMTIHFNENIKLSNVMEKLTVSPPQQKAPVILSNAKTVTIELQDTLIPNTTYTIDLGDAVVDNNEGNVLEHFALTFSTGDHIDSLKVGGILLNAEDLEPVTGAYVGLYPDTMAVGDSSFLSRPMIRAAKTNAYGAFSIAGVAPGRYAVYALKDGNTNYYYDLFTEDIAFLDSLVVPTVENRLVQDTVWADSVTVDTIRVHGHVDYGPADLVLRLFNEKKISLYMDDYARPDSARLTFRFSGPMPALPEFRFLDDTTRLSDERSVVEASAGLDTLTVWLSDSLLYRLDTLRMAVTYYYTDTLRRNVPKTDTLTFLKPVVRATSEGGGGLFGGLRERLTKKTDSRSGRAAADSVAPVRHMTVKALMGKSLDIGKKPVFEVSAPLASYDTAGIHLEQRVDTLWRPIPYRWIPDTAHIRRYIVQALPYYVPGGSYRLRIDSAAMYDIAGAPVAAAALDFQERMPEDYAHLLFNVRGIDAPAFIQLLDEKDKPVQQAPVVDGKAKFIHVVPGTYFVRMVVDSNGNGRFDTGNLTEHRQPEMVYYFNGKLQLRANWQLSQDWAPSSTDLVRQKPEEVKINKPKPKEEKKSRNAEYYAERGLKPRASSTAEKETGRR